MKTRRRKHRKLLSRRDWVGKDEPTPLPRKKRTPVDRAAVYEAVAAKVPLVQIAERLGTSQANISKMIKPAIDAGLLEAPRRGRPAIDPQEVLDEWILPGPPVAEIAAKFGVSRQRIDQIVRKMTTKSERDLWAERAAARRRLIAVVNGPEPTPIIPCRVCGLPSRKGGFCTDDHYRDWSSLRRFIDPHTKRLHRIAVARRAYELDPCERRRRYLERAIDGTMKSQGTWMIRGSRAHKAAVEAYRLGYPIYEQFEDPIKRQIEGDVAEIDRRVAVESGNGSPA